MSMTNSPFRRSLAALALLCAGCLVPVGYPFGDGVRETDATTTEAAASTSSTGDAPTSTDSSAPTGSSGSGSTTQSSEETTPSSATSGSESSSSEVSSTDTSEGTTGVGPSCGDSVINGPTQELPYAEECDDGNSEDDDGCHLCLRDRIMFVSSASFYGYELNGLSGADNRCRDLATAAGLRNSATYKAWLSDSQTAAGDRMTHGLGRYVLVTGTVVASSWDALVGGAPLQSPIDRTEKGMPREDGVWTGTNPNGSAAIGADHCANWHGGAGHEAFVGWSGEVVGWTLLPPPDVCDSSNSLYCVEQ